MVPETAPTAAAAAAAVAARAREGPAEGGNSEGRAGVAAAVTAGAEPDAEHAGHLPECLSLPAISAGRFPAAPGPCPAPHAKGMQFREFFYVHQTLHLYV